MNDDQLSGAFKNELRKRIKLNQVSKIHRKKNNIWAYDAKVLRCDENNFFCHTANRQTRLIHNYFYDWLLTNPWLIIFVRNDMVKSVCILMRKLQKEQEKLQRNAVKNAINCTL